MTYVVFRPYWNVPPSILRNEIIPAIQRDHGYIARKNYEVATYDGKVVTSGSISDDVLAQLRAGKLMVRQKPGPANALGLVKLIFPNEHNVYLHSTPLRSCSHAPAVISAMAAFASKSPPSSPRGPCAIIPDGRWSE